MQRSSARSEIGIGIGIEKLSDEKYTVAGKCDSYSAPFPKPSRGSSREL
ncbi:unnamed protein product [Linum tenue]|uniref:Uncharacterized protein n=1 Tax=Linum tenue TaxID=586396 RepID=A0AAV0JH81_9ROSI|nr:unnamed protein product [Linum tenue]